MGEVWVYVWCGAASGVVGGMIGGGLGLVSVWWSGRRGPRSWRHSRRNFSAARLAGPDGLVDSGRYPRILPGRIWVAWVEHERRQRIAGVLGAVIASKRGDEPPEAGVVVGGGPMPPLPPMRAEAGHE